MKYNFIQSDEELVANINYGDNIKRGMTLYNLKANPIRNRWLPSIIATT